MFHFCIPLKRKKTFSFLKFPGGVEMEHRAKQVNVKWTGEPDTNQNSSNLNKESDHLNHNLNLLSDISKINRLILSKL